MSDPNEYVEAVTSSGSRVYVTRRAAESWGHKINEGRPATDGHGRPLPTKPKINIPKAAKATTTKLQEG